MKTSYTKDISSFEGMRFKMKVRLNEDKEIVKAVKQGLKMKNGHCPCVLEIS